MTEITKCQIDEPMFRRKTSYSIDGSQKMRWISDTNPMQGIAMQPMKLHHINLQIRRTGTQAETSWSSVSIRLNTELSRLSMHEYKLNIAILRNVKRVLRNAFNV